MLEGVKTDHKCPECTSLLEYDVNVGEEIYLSGVASTGGLLVTIYCENDRCEYYTWRYVDPITKEIE